MPAANTFVLGNNQTKTFLHPYPIHSPVFPTIDFVATNPAQPGGAELGAPPGAPGYLGGQSSLVWNLQSIVAHGQPGHVVYGGLALEPYSGSVNILHGVSLSHANVLFDVPGGGAGPFTFDGTSTVTNGSTFTANGGRYAPEFPQGSPYVINGSMSVTNSSVANFDGVRLAGAGTIHVGSGSTVDAHTIAAGLHLDVDRGGTLSLIYDPNGSNSAATINLAAGGEVLISNATTATREIFHEASGTLDLLNKSGMQVASLKFAPGSHEYTSVAPIHGGLLEITTNPMMAGNLHTTFTH